MCAGAAPQLINTKGIVITIDQLEIQRRKFLKGVFAVTAALIGVVVGIPVVSAFLDPLRRRTIKVGDGLESYGPVTDLPIGKPVSRDVIARKQDAWDRSEPIPVGAVWLVRRDDKKVDAYSTVCPHLGCPIGFNEQTKVFACPCHSSNFALADGKVLGGPAPRNLDPLPVELKDGIVRVAYKRFISGIASRTEL